MAKRGYKLQEFVAHSGNVNCLSIGRKTLRNFLTGGDDQKVNLWSIGKPTCLTSLSGHTSPVESVAFDSAEVLVLAGSSSGAIKLWDLEETKMVRTVTGHRSYCTALEFHPFGEFFASGSMDTNLKIWDIRKKGCIHTYKGHTRGISTIKFSPDGRWVVSGGLDNVVKVWDLTAGKLLHDFKFHEGHVRSMEFHPLEFLLATGSADKTVKFWDLETFEMIGSTRREGSGVRSITFHPDGRTLFCGMDDSLKVYSWEPVVCHDSVDMGWSTLGDLCISDGKLLGGAYHENSVAVWVADISLIEPCGGSLVAERNSPSEEKVELQESPSQRTGSHKRSISNLRSSSPENDSKEIKNIYIDSGNCVVSRKEGSICSPTVAVPSESKDMSNHASQKQGSSLGSRPKPSGLGRSRSFTVPSIIPRNNPDGNESFGSGRESISTGRASSGMPLKPPHMRNPSHDIFNMEKMSVALETKDFDNMKMAADAKMDTDFSSRLNADNNAKESSEDKHSDIKIVAEKSPLAVSSDQENGNVALDRRKEVNATKVVNGVAVVRGRTRSLVERFEKRESLTSNEISPVNTPTHAVSGSPETSSLHTPDTTTHAESQAPQTSPLHTPDTTTHAESQAPKISPLQLHTPDTDTQATKDSPLHTPKMVTHEVFGAPETSPLHTPDTTTQAESQAPIIPPLQSHTPDTDTHAITQASNKSPWNTPKMATPRVNQAPKISPLHTPDTVTHAVSEAPAISPLQLHTPEAATQAITQAPKRLPLHTRRRATPIVTRAPRTSLLHTPDTATHAVRQAPKASPLQLYTPDMDTHAITQAPKTSPLHTPKMATSIVTRAPKTSVFQNVNRQDVDQQESGTNDSSVIESLMQSHDLLLSTFRSRLTKLQVVRHFWERNDVKGAINATAKLPDYSVQADVVSVLVERMGFITLDLFSCLLPVLVGLLDSKVERHAVVSLEMLLKLVAVFGPVVHSTVSAPPAVGVDLHAEQRLECCKECFVHLQIVRKVLPALTRKGGMLAKSALELNLVLQQS